LSPANKYNEQGFPNQREEMMHANKKKKCYDTLKENKCKERPSFSFSVILCFVRVIDVTSMCPKREREGERGKQQSFMKPTEKANKR
jgi:hypothetical protein